MSGCIQARARLQIEAIPCGEEVIRLAMLIDRHLAWPDDLKPISLYDDSGALVDADPKQLGMGLDHGDHIVFALALQQVLVHGHAAEESESFFITRGHHDGVARLSAPNQIRANDGRAGRASANHAASLQQRLKFPLGASIEVGIDQMPLASSAKEYAARFQ